MSDTQTKAVTVNLPAPLWGEVKESAKADGKLVSAKTAELLRKGLAADAATPNTDSK